MSDQNEKIAEALDEMAVLTSKLASYFRDGVSGSGSGGVNGTVKKPAAKSAAAGKVGSAAKGKAKAEPEESDLTIEEVREKLKELVEARGKEVMVQALESVGAGKLADVDESQYGELVVEVERLMEEEEPEEAPKPKTRTRSKAKAKGPTMDDLVEKFKELIEADRAKAKAVCKELGVAKISEVEDDDLVDAMAAVEAALAGDEDDDLL